MNTGNEFQTLVLRRSPAMVWLSLAVVVALAFFLLFLSVRLFAAQNVAGFLLLGVGGLLSGALAFIMFQGRNCVLILEAERFDSSDGRFSYSFDQMQDLGLGAFDFKPAGGILVRGQRKHRLYWQPGLIWALGRRVGIGGMVPKAACKAFAQEMSLRQQAHAKSLR